LKIKKTLYNWLTNRFLLIIRNEENFAEKRTFSFNYAKLIVFVISLLVLLFTINIYLINSIFYWFNPEYNEIETNKKLVSLYSEVDSLNEELRKKDLYGRNLQMILLGKPVSNFEDSVFGKSRVLTSRHINIDSLSPVDVQLRKEIEQKQGGLLKITKTASSNNDNYFIQPAEGVILQHFNPEKGKFGVEIATKSGEIVKSIADGVVVWANFSDEGYVIGIQHKNGFISIYKENTDILKSPGEYVNGGEGIAISGERKSSNENKVLFELWKEGTPINPENFISF
jgi:murein DD-endopeptidase MepM/ murein hydrolase activator NlpD